MGDLKESTGPRKQLESPTVFFCKGLLRILSALTVICSLVLVNYIQFNEILNLREVLRSQQGMVEVLDVRIKRLENSHGTNSQGDSRIKRDVPTDSLSSLVTSLVQQEVKVLENYCGNASKICLPGPRGDKGDKGDQGIKGSSGPSGPPGPKGNEGHYGVPGVPGYKGDPGKKGDTGTMGPKGEKGDFGPAGIPGPKGERGPYGVPGVPGTKGEPGQNGVPRLKGEKGAEGEPLPFDQQCCSTLAKPHYVGNQTEVIYTYAGQNILLPCRGTGYPPPTVTFSPSLDPQGRNRFSRTPAGMEIQNVAYTDSGKFTCTVENIFGKTTKTIELRVTDPVVATTTPIAVNVQVGKPFRIDCRVSGHPPPVVTWEFIRTNGQHASVQGAQMDSKTNSIIINKATALDAGSYICHAQNQYEKDQTTTVVTVTGKPQIYEPPTDKFVLEGSTVTLKCGVASNPPATITWTFPLTGSKPPLNALINPDNSVTLSAVDGSNSGTYVCTATNSMGTTTAQAMLNVEKGVTVNTSPHVQPLTGRETVLNFQCSASGIPAPTVSWSKDGVGSLAGNSKYLVLSGGNLIVTGVDVKTDTGTYRCSGRNTHGASNDTVIVYKDVGAVSCTATFGNLSCDAGTVCGGTCPASCVYSASQLYGFRTYPGESPVCAAATHTGSRPNPDGLVLWQHSASAATYTGATAHGLTSQAHASTPDSYHVLTPAKIDRAPSAGALFG